MKKILAALILCIPFMSFAQYEDVGVGWKKKKDRALIVQNMDKLINEVSFEYNCAKSEISYLVTEKHIFYQMKRDYLHFPKYVTIKACGETYYYHSECLQNGYGDPKDWIKCPWVLLPAEEEEEE
jgi:hypothetical protein